MTRGVARIVAASAALVCAGGTSARAAATTAPAPPAAERAGGDVLPPEAPSFGTLPPGQPAGPRGAGASSPDLLGEMGALEADAESLLDAIGALRRISLGEWRGSFAVRRDPVRESRLVDKASFHARTREEGAAKATLEAGRPPPFAEDARERRALVELHVASVQGDTRRTHALCMRILAFPEPPEEDVLLLCAIEAARGTAPERPASVRLGAGEFRAYASHGRVTGGSGALERAIVSATGFSNLGQPREGLAALREARMRARPTDPWLPRSTFAEALLRYSVGETDAAIDTLRALSGERLAVLAAFPFAPEAVDPATRTASLLHLARAYVVRRQWRAARDAYERLLGSPEAFVSKTLDASRAEARFLLFPTRSLFPRVPDPYEPLERRMVLGELAEVLWNAGDAAAGARAWRSSGATPTPRFLTALAADSASREEATLEAARRLGEARADLAYVRRLRSPSKGAPDFDAVKEKATGILALASLHGDAPESATARAKLVKWQPLLVSERAFFADVARLSEGVLSPVPFMETGVLERKEWIAHETLLSRQRDAWALARRADALSAQAWSATPFAGAHRDEIFRRLEASIDEVSRTTAAIARKGRRDNHRENARRVAALDEDLDVAEARLATLRFLARAEERRQLARGTVGVIAFTGWMAEGDALAAEIAKARSDLAEASLDARLLTLSDDATFPPDAAFRRALEVSTSSLSELATLHRASLSEARAFSSPRVRERLLALWDRIDALAKALQKASLDLRESATADRRGLAGDAQALLRERNAYAAALASARQASARAFEADVQEAATRLARHLERREDAWHGVLASANEGRLTDSATALEGIARARRERESLLRAFRTSLEAGTAR